MNDPFRRLAEVVIALELEGCGCDCGKYMHGACGSFIESTCEYCDSVAEVRKLLGIEVAG